MFYTSNVFNLGLHIANHVGLNEKLVKILAAQSMSVIKKDKDKEKKPAYLSSQKHRVWRNCIVIPDGHGLNSWPLWIQIVFLDHIY